MKQQNRSDRQGIPVRPVWVTNDILQLNKEKNPPPQSKSCLDFYLACIALTMPLRQGFMRREARKKLQKDIKEVKKALYPNKTPSPLGSEERESNPPTPFEQRYANYKNFDPSHPFAPYASTSHMRLTLSLEMTLVSKVPHLMHLLQSSQDLAWQMSSPLASLEIQILVWLVVPTCLFIIVLCHHSLTHPCRLGQDHIGLHHMIMPRRMINRRQGLKLLWTLIFFFLDDC
jgi:hypothetical protein